MVPIIPSESAGDGSSAPQTPDPLAYGPTGVRCGCGKDAHSNLVPCQPGREQEIRGRAEAAERRGRYAAAIRCAGVYDWHKLGDAAMAVADEELNRLRADRDAAVAAAVRRALEEAAKRQRKFVLSDDFVCDDWESALTVVDLIDPAVASPAREQGEAHGMACSNCETPVGWINCPTGGWWAHRQHPDDGHDAAPMPASALESPEATR